ncbi:unnamed protein product [Oikopleura dioica]|nr:unnamed protein product [Oikopleura dioica]
MHEEVVEMLNNCGERVNLGIQRSLSSNPLNIIENEFSELRIVQICKLSLGLGFNIVGGEIDNQGIFISYLHPTGVAESTGKINEGDQIIAVNNISFLNINHRDAVNILRSVDDFIVIELSFQPDKFHKLKEEIWQLREQNRKKVQHCDSVKL